MSQSRRQILRVAAAAPALALPWQAGLSWAQGAADYPNKEIRSICNLAAGSATDIITRFFADRLSKVANRTVIVENKVGAAGAIGVEAVARSRPDGYTIFIGGGSSAMAAAPNIYKKLPYDPNTDFEHVTTLLRVCFVMMVDGKKPIHSVADLTEHLKKRGDKANYGTSTSPGTVAAEMYKQAIGLNVLQVNYKTTQEILTDLAAGEIDFTFVSSATAKEQHASGRFRALAITPPERMAVTGDWPTMREVGIPAADILDFWSVHVPAKTPQPIVDKLEGWFNQIVRMEETKAFLWNIGADPYPGNQKLVRELIPAQRRKWADYMKIAKIEPV